MNFLTLTLDSAKKAWNAFFCLDGNAKKISSLEFQLSRFKNASVCELAAENSNLMEYMNHWEDRALKAENSLHMSESERNTLRYLLIVQTDVLENLLYKAGLQLGEEEDEAVIHIVNMWIEYVRTTFGTKSTKA